MMCAVTAFHIMHVNERFVNKDMCAYDSLFVTSRLLIYALEIFARRELCYGTPSGPGTLCSFHPFHSLRFVDCILLFRSFLVCAAVAVQYWPPLFCSSVVNGCFEGVQGVLCIAPIALRGFHDENPSKNRVGAAR